VAALAPDDIWAVGATGSSFSNQPLVLHWDGQAWSVVPSPNPGFRHNYLSGVAALRLDDVWAVGGVSMGVGTSQVLILHWDGRQWSLVPEPGLGPGYTLTAVAGVAPDDVWAVGHSGVHALALRWNGTQWNRVPIPQPGSSSTLTGVAVPAADDAWAVGYYTSAGTYHERTLILHWDGIAWSQVPAPNPGDMNYLHGVAATAADDVWAAGYATIDGSGEPLLAHWDGARWSVVPGPTNEGGLLYSVTARARDDAWAVGTAGRTTLTLHWDGQAWTRVPSPSSSSDLNLLWGVAAVEAEVWAVGAYNIPSYDGKTLTLHYADPCATPTPTATGTPPSPTPTRTPPPPPTACPLQFSDVPPDSPFYGFVRCLACRGIVAGYADGTFRPGNAITRGQMSKLIAGAAGYADPIPGGQQTFADVELTHPFWLFVERAAAHGVISGYTCGGAGEPCPGRYFRPGAAVTRGQAAKFVTGAAGWTDPIPAGRRSFVDVTPGDPFWIFVERAYLHEAISGYTCDGQTRNPCGGQLEQCPGLYYRPCNNVTRGQAAKLLAGAFFPVCRPPARP
jgi:hypothetical protein